jgi:hypothetical protein
MRRCGGSRIGKSTRRKADGCHRRRGSSPRDLASGALVQIVAEDVPAEGHVVTMLACIARTVLLSTASSRRAHGGSKRSSPQPRRPRSPRLASADDAAAVRSHRKKRDSFHGTWKVRPPTSCTLVGSTRTGTAAGFGSRNAALTASSPNSRHPIRMCVVPARRHRPPIAPTAMYPIERYRLGSNPRDRL